MRPCCGVYTRCPAALASRSPSHQRQVAHRRVSARKSRISPKLAGESQPTLNSRRSRRLKAELEAERYHGVKLEDLVLVDFRLNLQTFLLDILVEDGFGLPGEISEPHQVDLGLPGESHAEVKKQRDPA